MSAAGGASLGRNAVRVVRARHRLDWGWWQSLGRVRGQLPGIVRHWLCRIDRRVDVRVRARLHHAGVLPMPKQPVNVTSPPRVRAFRPGEVLATV